MRILGNIIWFFMAGWILAILTYLSGLILTILVVTAPVGLGLMVYGKFIFLPFTNDMVRKNKSSLIVAAKSLQNYEYDVTPQKVVRIEGNSYSMHRSDRFTCSSDCATWGSY